MSATARRSSRGGETAGGSLETSLCTVCHSIVLNFPFCLLGNPKNFSLCHAALEIKAERHKTELLFAVADPSLLYWVGAGSRCTGVHTDTQAHT